MRIVLLTTLLIALLAGCTDSPNEPEAETTDDHSDLDHNTTMEPVQNVTVNATAPTLHLTGAVEGLAPTTVQFNLTVRDAADPANATWSLTNGNETQEGTGLPATTNLTFETDGNYTVVATATVDGFTISAEQNITVEGGVPSGVLLETVTWAASGSLVSGFQWCGFQEGFDLATPIWEAGSLTGQPYVIANVNFEFTTSETAGAVRLDILGPGGNEIGSTSSGQIGGDGMLHIAGPLQPGDYTAEVAVCTGVAPDYEFTMTADLLTP